LEWAAAWVLVAATLIVAVFQMIRALSSRTAAALWMLAASSLSLAAGGFLAAAYALSEYLEAGWLDIPTMIPLHGLTMAVGFSLLGLIGWNLLPAPAPDDNTSNQAQKIPPPKPVRTG